MLPNGETYSHHILTSINNVWAILNKYNILTDLAPAMFAVVALQLEMKYEYFKNAWKDQPAIIEAAHTKIENQLETFYQSSATTDLVALSASLLPSASLYCWKQKLAGQSSVRHNTDQLHPFQYSPAEDDIQDPIMF
jgi:hypothetical protein